MKLFILTLAITVFPLMARAADPQIMGMSTPLGELAYPAGTMQSEIDDYKAMGVKIVRFDIHWDVVQSSSTAGYNWTEIDGPVNAMFAKGFKMLALLNTDVPSGYSKRFDTAATRTAYANFAKAAAIRYAGKIDSWEILNEPNMVECSGCNRPQVLPSDYTKLLIETANAIRSVNSSAFIVSTGLAAIPQKWNGSGFEANNNGHYASVDYLREIYLNGGKNYFNAVGYHAYTFGNDYPSMNDSWNGWEMMEMKGGIRDIMVQNGDSAKQVWITEIGAPTAGTGWLPPKTEAGQDRLLKEAYNQAKATTWIGPILWYSYKDRGPASWSGNSTESFFGLIRPDGSQKPAYATYKAFANAAPSAPTPIIGTAGSDTLVGTSGPDLIIGNGGNDTITGGAGNDIYEFGPSANIGWPYINDFVKGDVIDLSKIDANTKVAGDQGFSFIGSNWLGGSPAKLGFYKVPSGNFTDVRGDVDGDGISEFTIKFKGLIDFTASDFKL